MKGKLQWYELQTRDPNSVRWTAVWRTVAWARLWEWFEQLPLFADFGGKEYRIVRHETYENGNRFTQVLKRANGRRAVRTGGATDGL